MATRTTLDDLLQIYDQPAKLEDRFVGNILDRANRFVDALLSSAGLSELALKDIETHLAAYFANVMRPHVNTTSVGSVSGTQGASYSYVGLWSDPYGQRAIELDTSGTLLEYARRQQAASRGKDDGASVVTILGGSSADPDVDWSDPDYL